tara:strand:- start:200 stop:1402 length:1203 start_codon:yes stop_codon:yes gene_type:complete
MALTKTPSELTAADITITTAAQPNITSVGTLTGFTSTGIDDNATSTTITITSDNFVGLGTGSPDDNSFGAGNGILAVASSTGSAKTAMLNLMGDGNDTNATRVASLFFNDQSATGAGKSLAGIEAYRASNHATDPGGDIVFSTNTSGGSYAERLRIAAAGTATFQHPIVVQSGATQGYYIENNAGNAVTPRITNDANDHTVIRPGKSGGAVQWNNFANDAELMRLNSSGQFIVGRTTDDVDTIGAMMDQNGIVYSSINETTFNTFLYRAAQSANAYRFYVNGSGQVSSTFTSISSLSDGRLKENVRDYTAGGLSEILKLKPRVFDWKENEGKNIKNDIGFIAQEFEEVFPDWISNFLHDDLEDAKTVAASELIFPMVNAIKELSTEIESLKAEVKALKEA